MKILLLGSAGQVGKAMLRQIPKDWSVSAWSRADVDHSDPLAVRLKLDEYARSGGVPDYIVNCAAYTQVDLAESHSLEATRLNVDLPTALAEVSKSWGSRLVHYSSDYVYSGEGSGPYSESDRTGPINRYGHTKLLGDQAVQASGADSIIFRTSWIFGSTGRNFLLTMLKLGRDKEELRVVSDQVGSPTLADDLAGGTLEAMKLAARMPIFPSGVYHFTNSGFTSWHGFAEAIFRESRSLGVPVKVRRVLPIPTHDYPTPARRPLNSRLDCTKSNSAFGLRPRSWEEALKETVALAVKGLT